MATAKATALCGLGWSVGREAGFSAALLVKPSSFGRNDNVFVVGCIGIFAAAKMAHLNDDEAVVKMGHPVLMGSPVFFGLGWGRG